ncbi:hypothetical protein KSF73_09625 [Burkholderiaceae bacterium DAT-1]|nr:hypothetical protein [Burkholderiaceae bacterium DAT-1]
MSQTDNSSEYRGSRANTPDLDWSQVGETVLILEVVAGQVMAAMRDSEDSVDHLAATFTSMGGYVRNMSELVREIPTTPENAAQKAALLGITEQVGSMMNQAVVSFQFYDKMVQRLSHVVDGLDDVSDLISDRARLYVPTEWAALQARFRSKFSTIEERALFDAVLLQGVPVKAALENYVAALQDKGNDIELF